MAARARSDVREEAILLATMALLGEVGYDRMTVEAVAERAKASKATVYRRWSGKAELVATAVRRYAGTALAPLEPTGDPRTDLLALLNVLRASLLGQDAALILGLLGAMRHDTELARTVRQAVLDHKHEAFAALLPAADHAWLAELTSAALLSRLLVTGEPLDDEFLAKLVDTVLLPQLSRKPPCGT
jgi:AcrR family transcriptional regulator